MKNNTDGIGWGFFGAGSISATVAQEVRNFGGGRLVAVCGRNLERTKAFADTHGFEVAYDQPDALLNDRRVDAVYIALPHSLHVETILRALDAGKHVLCEKPLAMTAEEAARVMAHPRSQSLVIAEGFMVRHHPQWKWILETIASGQIGKVRAIQAHSCLMLPAGNPGTGLPGEGSLLLDIGCYSVHLVRTIAGAEPRQISARMEFAANTQRDNLIRADRLAEDQKHEQESKIARSQAVEQLVIGFDRQIGTIAHDVSTAAAQARQKRRAAAVAGELAADLRRSAVVRRRFHHEPVHRTAGIRPHA